MYKWVLGRADNLSQSQTLFTLGSSPSGRTVTWPIRIVTKAPIGARTLHSATVTIETGLASLEAGTPSVTWVTCAVSATSRAVAMVTFTRAAAVAAGLITAGSLPASIARAVPGRWVTWPVNTAAGFAAVHSPQSSGARDSARLPLPACHAAAQPAYWVARARRVGATGAVVKAVHSVSVIGARGLALLARKSRRTAAGPRLLSTNTDKLLNRLLKNREHIKRWKLFLKDDALGHDSFLSLVAGHATGHSSLPSPTSSC